MKIIRNGKEIELTDEELFSAYKEQENKYDLQNIEENMAYYLSETEYSILRDNSEFINEAANKLRINQDKYSMSYERALNEAFESAKAKLL